MTYKYSLELEKKAIEFIKYLGEKGLEADILTESFRDYLVKVSVFKNTEPLGNVSIYFSPSKNKYTLVLIETAAAYKEEIEKLWLEMNFDFKPPVYKNKGIEIDVDGACRNEITSYAAIIRKDGNVIEKLSGVVPGSEVLGSYQVAGELQAVIQSLKWCNLNKIKKVTIYYDMEGIEMWATGKWKTKKEITKSFSEFFKKNKIKIDWVKIESHSGVKWNEETDKLAKKAITEYGKTVKRRK